MQFEAIFEYQIGWLSMRKITLRFLYNYKRFAMPGKKWCEYCRINLPFEKKAIQDHESTRLHIQNKQRHITYERIKIMKEQKAAK